MRTVKLIWEETIFRDLKADEIPNAVNVFLEQRKGTSDASDIIIEDEIDGTFSVSNKVVKESFVDGERVWKSE